MHWQDLRKVDPDPGKMLQIFCSGNCYFAKAFKRQDGSMIFVLSHTYKALLDIKNELLPFYTLEQLQKRYAYWSLFTKPGESK